MNDIPAPTITTANAIMADYKKRGDEEQRFSRRLGAGIIGNECERALWYSFRHCVRAEFEGRQYRLFATGHLEEPRIVADLRAIGCEVYDVDPDTGKQWEWPEIDGHFVCKPDGVVRGIPEAPKAWHVLEIKTHSSKSYAGLAKGVAKSKPLHVAQMMAGMGLGVLPRALYLAKDKNTDALLSERIRFDRKEFEALMAKARRIIYAERIPERLAQRPDDFRCRFCDAIELCWGAVAEVAVPIPEINCRNCCFSTPLPGGDGQWSCAKFCNFDVRYKWQGDGPHPPCDDHLLLPDLVGFAQATDAGDDWIEFTNNDGGAVWRHGKSGPATWSTADLMGGRGPMDPGATPPAPFGDDLIPRTLLDCYPPEDCYRLWEGPANSSGGFEALCHALGLLSREGIPAPTRREETDETLATEFDGKFLLVLYKPDRHVALWQGVE